MRCQLDSDRRRANTPNARMHGGDNDVGDCGGGCRWGWRSIGQRVKRQGERYMIGTGDGGRRDGIEM
jgi:hypothetical protein